MDTVFLFLFLFPYLNCKQYILRGTGEAMGSPKQIITFALCLQGGSESTSFPFSLKKKSPFFLQKKLRVKNDP